MPALRWLGRRWTVGADDFAVLGTLYAASHLALGIALLAIATGTQLIGTRCPGASIHLLVSAQILIASHVLGFLSFIALAINSLFGRILEPTKRWFVPIALYLCALAVIAQAVGSIYLLTQFHNGPVTSVSRCDQGTYRILLAEVIIDFLSWIYFIIYFLLQFSTVDKLDSFNDVHQVWDSRMRTVCCCWSKAENDDVFEGIAVVFAALFAGHDIVPSDIAAGLVLVYAHQQRMYEKRLALVASQTGPIPSMRGEMSPTFRAPHRWSEDDRRTLQVIRHFSHFMLGAYGHLNYIFMHPLTGVPHLICSDPCACSRSRPGIHLGGCWKCDATALQIITGLPDEDVIMTSFVNDVRQPCFYVAVDRSTRSIVIVVRGTMSIEDLMTDGAATPQEFRLRDLPEPAYAHSGFFHSAERIVQQLRAQGIIDNVFLQSHRDHSIVVIGHSLGAGVAIIMTLLLRDQLGELTAAADGGVSPKDVRGSAAAEQSSARHRIRCIAYAPPGGLLSRNAAEYTRPFVVGCFFGKDLVPRLSMHSIHELRDSMFHALASCQQPKAAVLSHLCCPTATQSLPLADVELTPEVHSSLKKLLTPPVVTNPLWKDVRLYPPVNMVHFVTVSHATGPGEVCCGPHGCTHCDRIDCGEAVCCAHDFHCPQWIDIDDLQYIVCAPEMVMDHLPDRFWHVIQRSVGMVLNGEMNEFEAAGSAGAGHHQPTDAEEGRGGGEPASQREAHDPTVRDLLYRPRYKSDFDRLYGAADISRSDTY